MKTLFPIFILILFSCNDHAPQKGGWGQMHVHGPVQEMTVHIYSVKEEDGEIVPNEANELYYEDHGFDSIGNLQESYIKQLHTMFISVYKKGSNDLLYTSNPKVNPDAIDTVIYTNGKMDSIITKDQASSLVYNTTKLKLNEDGRVVERIKRNNEGVIIEITKTEYKNGMIALETVTDGSKLLRKTENEVDGSGKLQSMIVTDGEKELLYAKFKYSGYDKHDNWTERIAYNRDGKATTIMKRYFMYYGDKK